MIRNDQPIVGPTAPLRERYLKAVEDAHKAVDDSRVALDEAQAAFDAAQAKLAAYDLVAEDLPTDSIRAAPLTLKESEVEEVVIGMQSTFTYKEVVKAANKRHGQFIDAFPVRTWLNRIAQREGSPIELVKAGVGPNPSVFRVRKEAEVAH